MEMQDQGVASIAIRCHSGIRSPTFINRTKGNTPPPSPRRFGVGWFEIRAIKSIAYGEIFTRKRPKRTFVTPVYAMGSKRSMAEIDVRRSHRRCEIRSKCPCSLRHDTELFPPTG